MINAFCSFVAWMRFIQFYTDVVMIIISYQEVTTEHCHYGDYQNSPQYYVRGIITVNVATDVALIQHL